MSSFNYFSPQTKSKPISFPTSISSNKSSSISTLNPDASTYIPSYAYTNKSTPSPSLNASAAPYIPLPPKLNLNQKRCKHNKTPCPSFTHYSNLNSSQIYNATYKYIEMSNKNGSETEQTDQKDNDILSDVSSSIMDTPVPASVTSSVFSENDIDLMNIEPYIPNQTMTDIDGINNIIHQNDGIDIETTTDSSDELHPVIAALTEKESNELLNAPIWTPDCDNNMEDEQEITYSKIAIDEQDYQFIIHPNKKPIKYGYIQANIGKIAQESSHGYMPPHIEYMNNAIAPDPEDDSCLQPTIEATIAGETYNENNNINTINIKANNDRISENNHIEINNRSDKCADDVTITTHTNRNTNNLYSNKASRIAMEGYCAVENNQSNIYKIAYDTYMYNQSRIAQPYIEKISYVYCKT